VPEGNYQVRVDYLGYQFTTENFMVGADRDETLTIAHQDVEISVLLLGNKGSTSKGSDGKGSDGKGSDGKGSGSKDSNEKGSDGKGSKGGKGSAKHAASMSRDSASGNSARTGDSNIKTTSAPADIALTLFTANGAEVGVSTVTDDNGQAVFHLPEQEYKVRADYLDQQYWSDVFVWTDTDINIETGTAVVTATSRDEPLKDVTVTACSSTGTAFDITDNTKGTGEAFFTLPAGTYLFKVDYQGHQYWSGAVEIIAYQQSEVFIDAGGGTFPLTLATDSGEPLSNASTSLYSAAGVNLGESASTDKNGEVSYELADGEYRIRIDYLGYEYWTEVISVPELTALDHVIAHQDVLVTANLVYQNDLEPLKNAQVSLFTPEGEDLKAREKIDQDYNASFSLPERAYQARLTYLDQEFISETFTWTDNEITINQGLAELTLTEAGHPLSGVEISVSSATGTELGVSAETSTDGVAEILLPEGSYTFLAQYGEIQYWAVGEIVAHQVNPINLQSGAGSVFLTVKASEVEALQDLPCSLYDASGNYLEQSAATNKQGMVTFAVSQGDYKIMVEYMGRQYWTEQLTAPDAPSGTLLIEHDSVTVTVTGDSDDEQFPLAGLPCALFTSEGVNTGVTAVTDDKGEIHLSMPLDGFQVKTEYLGHEYWSDTFNWFDSEISIPPGKIFVHITDLPADSDATVYLRDASGEALDLSSIPDTDGYAYLDVPVGSYKLLIKVDDTQYWSEVIHVLDYQTTDVELSLADKQSLSHENGWRGARVSGTTRLPGFTA
jgi:hypothetical protein